MPTTVVTRTFQFCAGHRLYRPDWSDAENARVFGKCANPNGHGHNYTLELSLGGPVDRETGMIINLRQVKELVDARVLADVDHKNLNLDVPWMKGAIPTTEVFAERLWERLAEVFASAAPGIRLDRLVLHETPNNRVTVTA